VLAAAESSFDCRTARTARELATCADARIAAADRELAAAWQNAIAPLDPATVKALREPIRRNSSKISTAASRRGLGQAESAGGKRDDRLPEMAADLVRHHVAVIATPLSTQAAIAVPT
jgi:uncharacterized protein